MAFDTPIVLMCFNRPDLTRLVLRRIEEIKPSTFLVVMDGARPNVPGECQKVSEVRSLLSNLSWPCQVLTNISEKNLGCKQRISSGLTWVFEKVPRAIIVEDDCMLDPSFFYWAQKMLQDFENDERVFHITAENLLPQKLQDPRAPAFFSKYGTIWGWATWARAWKYYDVSMVDWEEHRNVFLGHPLFEAFEATAHGKIDTWDYQWMYQLLRRGALSVVPPVNAVQNLGFRSDATHTKLMDHFLADLVSGTIREPYLLNSKVVANINYDQFIEKNIFQLPRPKLLQKCAHFAKKLIQRIIP